jgi:hypothetical protein
MDGIKLRRVLNAEFGKARAMQGFKYRDRLNQIFVYLYESEAARRSSGANWLAMLYWDSYDGRVKQPRVSINNAKVDGLRSAPPNLSQDSNNKNARNSLNNMKLEYKLATVDAGYRVQPDDISIARFGSLLDQLANKYVEDRIKIADVTVAAMNILREKGLREKLLNIMEGLNSIFYEPLQNQKYAQHVAIYVTLRNKGESHFGAVSGLRASFRVLRVN